MERLAQGTDWSECEVTQLCVTFRARCGIRSAVIGRPERIAGRRLQPAQGPGRDEVPDQGGAAGHGKPSSGPCSGAARPPTSSSATATTLSKPSAAACTESNDAPTSLRDASPKPASRSTRQLNGKVSICQLADHAHGTDAMLTVSGRAAPAPGRAHLAPPVARHRRRRRVARPPIWRSHRYRPGSQCEEFASTRRPAGVVGRPRPGRARQADGGPNRAARVVGARCDMHRCGGGEGWGWLELADA